jgi:hypothetical protein
VVIESAGLRFVAERVLLSFVAELRVDVRTCGGRRELVLSHPTWTPSGKC